jgi:hypothetical protein
LLIMCGMRRLAYLARRSDIRQTRLLGGFAPYCRASAAMELSLPPPKRESIEWTFISG